MTPGAPPAPTRRGVGTQGPVRGTGPGCCPTGAAKLGAQAQQGSHARRAGRGVVARGRGCAGREGLPLHPPPRGCPFPGCWGHLPLLLLPGLPLPGLRADPQRVCQWRSGEKAPDVPPGAVPPDGWPAGGSSAARAPSPSAQPPGRPSPRRGLCYLTVGALPPLTPPLGGDSLSTQRCPDHCGAPSCPQPHPSCILTRWPQWGARPSGPEQASPANLCRAFRRRGQGIEATSPTPTWGPAHRLLWPAGHGSGQRHSVVLAPAGGVGHAGAPGPHQGPEDCLHVPGLPGREGGLGPGDCRPGTPSLSSLPGTVRVTPALPTSPRGGHL